MIIFDALESIDVLLKKVSFDGHSAPRTLAKIYFFVALVQLVLRVATHFDDLGAAGTISKHLALQNVMQIHLVSICEVWLGDVTELARDVLLFAI